MTDADLLIPNEIIRTNRNSISLIIKNNGDFIVRAPMKSSEKSIFNFINEKANWIILKRKEQKANAVAPLTFNNMEKLNLLGKERTLTFEDVSKVKCYDYHIVLPKTNTKERLIFFLKKFAKEYISSRVKILANLFGFDYNSISINSAKTCWGSCSGKNKLNFTYRLIMCPPDVVDYIVLHELCHTKVKNHSKQFWLLIEKYDPYYKTHEKWLKVNRGIIEVI